MSTHRELAHVQSGYSLAPRNFEEAERLANIIANSGICPSSLRGRPSDVLVILQMGHELRLQPMQALRTLGCINGLPFAYGDGFLALIKRHPEFVDIDEGIEGDINSGDATAYCTMTRKGQAPQTRYFSIKDAMRAGLWKKAGVWSQYPQRMLQHRARTYCGKDVFPDAVFGLMTEDEVKGMPTVHEVQKPVSQGLNGLRETLQTKPKEEMVIEAELIQAPEDILSDIPTEEESAEQIAEIVTYDDQDKNIPAEPLTGLDELKRLISHHQIKGTSIKSYLTRCGVKRIDELNDEQISKWSNHLKLKETK